MPNRRGISVTRLMEESELHIDNVRRQDSSPQQQIVERLFASPKTYIRWESEHFRLMQFIGEDLRADNELHKLRKACFRLTHSKALFEYLRDHKVTGADRSAIFRVYYFGALDYSEAVIAEHGRFLRANLSLLCADHIGASLLRDETFIESLPGYQSMYADYVALYCGRIIAENRGLEYASELLINDMKKATSETRIKMLAVIPRRRAEDAVPYIPRWARGH